jgi:hypothetical protein
MRSVRGEHDLFHTFAVALEYSDLFSAARVPEFDRAIRAAGDQLAAISRKGRRNHLVLVLAQFDYSLRLDLPKSDKAAGETEGHCLRIHGNIQAEDVAVEWENPFRNDSLRVEIPNAKGVSVRKA